MKSRIIIVGAGGSGKDVLKQRFVDKGYKPSKSHTTRPPRKGETEKDYYFVDEDEFKAMIHLFEFFEYRNFNNWYYGTTLKEYDKSEVFIMSPDAIKALSKETREKSFVVYLDIEENLRSKRMSGRKDADDVTRRIESDREDFNCFTDYDLRITNPNF